MLDGLLVWSGFAVGGGLIIFAGPKLSRYGDGIAEKTGLERSWIGVILLALVTSLPEVATSITAALIDQPDLVFGNVFGSNLFNIFIIALLDLMYSPPPVLERANRSNLVISGFGIKMMAVALIPYALYNIPGLGIKPLLLFGTVDISTLIIIALYVYGMRIIFLQQSEEEAETGEVKELYAHQSQKQIIFLFTFWAVLIIGAGIGMSLLADIIATYEIPIGEGIPIGESLVGIILLAIVTSLPELTVSIGALRLGAVDMAVGNVLGSNMFNMLIIGVADFFYSPGSILTRPNVTDHARVTGLASTLLVGLAGIIMLGIVTSKISFNLKRARRVPLSSIGLILIFVITYALLFYINL
jgi:cation:H+ antiporter